MIDKPMEVAMTNQETACRRLVEVVDELLGNFDESSGYALTKEAQYRIDLHELVRQAIIDVKEAESG